MTLKRQTVNIVLKLEAIELPIWARDVGINGELLVPTEAIQKGDTHWESVDWWLAAFMMLESWHEREFESLKGPIHSYARKLQKWDTRYWDKAWVNRIIIFLRKWAAFSHCKQESLLFGKLPPATFILTHDVDALAKTLQIRVKQGAFEMHNVARNLKSESTENTFKELLRIFKFVFKGDDWYQISRVISLESSMGLKSIFNFHITCEPKGTIGRLLDPSYAPSAEVTKLAINSVLDSGHTIGLHPSFDSWKSSERISQQKKILSELSRTHIRDVRQHWLKFSWKDTWECQEIAGLENDYTLMFNDKSGFRNGSALTWNPYNPNTKLGRKLKVTPTVLMDSHLYNYENYDERGRRDRISELVNECKEVGGTAAFLWHPHTLSDDYGWKPGFISLLNAISHIS
jgi:hypothetical protein